MQSTADDRRDDAEYTLASGRRQRHENYHRVTRTSDPLPRPVLQSSPVQYALHARFSDAIGLTEQVSFQGFVLCRAVMLNEPKPSTLRLDQDRD